MHGADKAKDVEGGVGGVEAMGEAAHQQQGEDMEWDEVDDVDVAAPRTHHVEVGKGSHRCPKQAARLYRFDLLQGKGVILSL